MLESVFFITPDMKYAYIRALSIFEDRGGVGVFYYTVHKPQAKRPRSLEAAQC